MSDQNNNDEQVNDFRTGGGIDWLFAIYFTDISEWVKRHLSFNIYFQQFLIWAGLACIFGVFFSIIALSIINAFANQ